MTQITAEMVKALRAKTDQPMMECKKALTEASGDEEKAVATERTFVMVKPDGVERRLVGEVIGRLERKGLTLCNMRMLKIDEDLARRHYAEHIERVSRLVPWLRRGNRR